MMANFNFPYPRKQLVHMGRGNAATDINYSERYLYKNPYAIWFNNLIAGLTSLTPEERLSQFDAYYYVQEGIKGYGIGKGGSRAIGWGINWLSDITIMELRAQEGM